jgi:hypothetical protein
MFSVTITQQSVLLFANLFSYSVFLILPPSKTYKFIVDWPPVASTIQSLKLHSSIRSLSDSLQHSPSWPFSHNIVIHLFISLLLKICLWETTTILVECLWNVMAHAQKPDFFFRRNGRVHLNRRGRQFSRLLAAVVCASALVMLDTPCSGVVWEYWIPILFVSFLFISPPVHHLVPSHFNLDSKTYWQGDWLCFECNIWACSKLRGEKDELLLCDLQTLLQWNLSLHTIQEA